MRQTALLALFLAVLAATAAEAGGKNDNGPQFIPQTTPRPVPPALQEPSVLAPYQFTPPTNLTPLEQQKAFAYRSRVQTQLRGLELQQSFGRLDPQGQRQLMDTRSELNRLQRLLLP